MNFPAVYSSIPRGTGSECEGAAGETRLFQEIIAERRRQIEQFGHTAEADRALPVHQLVRHVQQQMQGASDYALTNKHELTRRYLVKTMATALAAIERIDFELSKEGENPK